MADEWEDVAYGASAGTSSSADGGEWEDVAVGAPKPWNLQDSAKQFFSGGVEGLTGLASLLADYGSPSNAFDTLVDKVIGGPTKADWRNKSLEEVAKKITVEPTKQYHPERVAGNFVIPNVLLPGLSMTAKLLSGAGGAVGQLMGEKVTQGSEETVWGKSIPLVLSVLGGGAGQVADDVGRGLLGRGGVLRSASPEQLEASASHILNNELKLTPREIGEAIIATPNDDVGALRTTAELTGNAQMGQLEKNLAQTGDAAQEYAARGLARENARTGLLGKTTNTEAIKNEVLGQELIDRAVESKGLKSAAEREAWSITNKKAEIPIKDAQEDLLAVLAENESPLPLSSKTRDLVEALLDTDMGSTQSAGRLQAIRSESLKHLRNLQKEGTASSFDEVVLNRISKAISEAEDNGLVGLDKELTTDARRKTADVKNTYEKRGTTGFNLVSEKTTPENALDKAFLGDRRSVQQTRSALSKPVLTKSGAWASDIPDVENLKRGVIDSIPRDASGKLTPYRTSKFVKENETGLRELFGDDHFEKFKRVVEDLDSEASVSANAYAASKGGSVTAQKQTVGGTLHAMVMEGLLPGSGSASVLVDAIKRSVGDKNSEGLKQLLFKAAMEPSFALKLSQVPTRKRVLNGLEAFKNFVEKGVVSSGKAGALSMSSPEKPVTPKSVLNTNKSALGSKPSVLAPKVKPTPAPQQEAMSSKELHPAITPKLLAALRAQESDGDDKAVSDKGAKGPYQFLDETGKEYHTKLGIKEAYNPFNEPQARRLAEAYLNDLLEMFNGDLEKALTAYHSGPKRVKEGRLGPIGRAYAGSVLRRMG